MPSNYPTGLDVLENAKDNDTLELDDHPGVHNDIADAIMAMETELGIAPSGSDADVKARLDRMEADIASGTGPITYPLDPRAAPYNLNTIDSPAVQRTSIQNALIDGDIQMPAGQWQIAHRTAGDTNTSIYVPTRRTMYLPSAADILQTDACQQMFRFGGDGTASHLGGKGNNGGIIGGGRLLAARQAQRCVLVDSWHGIKLMDFGVCDQVYAGIHIKPNVFATGDSDGAHINHIIHNHDSASVTTALRPQRFIVVEGGGGAGAGASDNVIDGNCYVSDGLAADSNGDGSANDGGWGIEVINASRIQIVNFGCFDNTRFYAGAVLIRVNSAAGGTQTGNVVDTMYTEGQASGPAGTWMHRAVEVRADSGATQQTRDHSIERLRFASTAGAGGKRLRCVNNVALNPAGQIQKVSYLSPRNDLGSNGQIQLDDGVTNCVVQLMGAQTGFVKKLDNTTAPDASNKIVNLLA